MKLFSVIEPCSHEVQYAGMCANCGKNLTVGDYLGNADTSRATVAMTHDTLGLTVSYSEAARLERDTTKRLLQSSKLSLIVDLDQCVIQTAVDPTIGEWLRDESNPNHRFLKDIHQFRIAEEGPTAPVYYVKPRPYLDQFLSTISKKFEMHIYTMGTRPYALKIASVIDPEGKFFGSRILSRDENGSNTQKSVQRLFPVETNMVVIMDDRADVWQWSPNLIKVDPFEFFVGIGDINSSFLPKLNDRPVPAIPKLVPKAAKTDDIQFPTVSSEPELAATLVTNTTIDDPDVLAAQADAQTASLEAQVEDRPLAKQQEALTTDESGAHHGESLLKNDDEQLKHLETILRKLHERFYKTYNSQIMEMTQDRNLAKLKNKRPNRRSKGAPADVKSILPEMKTVVLKDIAIVFSGLFRSDQDPRQQWQGRLAVQFGARVLDNRSKEQPTHVIVGPGITSQNLTEKARMYKRYPWIKLVYLKWLIDCTSQFQRLNENEYQVDRSAPHVPRPVDWNRNTTEDGHSDTESIMTDNGVTDRLINETSKTWDWHDMDGEIEEFCDSSDDGTTEASDNDSDSSLPSVRSSTSTRQKTSHKRMRSGNGLGSDFEDIATSGTNDLLRSPLAKRRNVAKQRKSGLGRSTRANSPSSSDPDSGQRAEDENDDLASRAEPTSSPVPHTGPLQSTLPAVTTAAGTRAVEFDAPHSSDGSDFDDFANELELQLEG